MTVHELMTGESSITAEYGAKYGFLASPGCCNKILYDNIFNCHSLNIIEDRMVCGHTRVTPDYDNYPILSVAGQDRMHGNDHNKQIIFISFTNSHYML
ncbi:MAG TPA: hypothetical protein VIY98_13650 [Nitrososphaeraceae archaeon]